MLGEALIMVPRMPVEEAYVHHGVTISTIFILTLLILGCSSAAASERSLPRPPLPHGMGLSRLGKGDAVVKMTSRLSPICFHPRFIPSKVSIYSFLLLIASH